jgi:hypothetical protein
MSEQCEYFDDLRAVSQDKRRKNREWSAEYLRKLGINFTTNNGGVHLMISQQETIVDFWPGTGKWIVRPTREQKKLEGRGVLNLVKELRRRWHST